MDARSAHALGITLLILGSLVLLVGLGGTTWALVDTCSAVEEENDRCATTDLEVIMMPVSMLGLIATGTGIFLTVRYGGPERSPPTPQA